jgi:hypothetical protein
LGAVETFFRKKSRGTFPGFLIFMQVFLLRGVAGAVGLHPYEASTAGFD